MSEPLAVTYLFNHTCPSFERGRELLDAAAEQAGVRLATTVVEVLDDQQAEKLNFPGSPTYLLDGHDPFSPPTGVPIAAEACRAYTRSDGRIGPLPSLDDLAAALTRAASGAAP